jgi:hypothetical protein
MTISIQTLAAILILAHIGSGIFMTVVISKQYRLFSRSITPDDALYQDNDIKKIKNFRLRLFLLSGVILGGNTIPILIDGITIFSHNALHRNPHVPLISIAYAASNALTALVSAYLINTLYRIAQSANDPDELIEKNISDRH